VPPGTVLSTLKHQRRGEGLVARAQGAFPWDRIQCGRFARGGSQKQRRVHLRAGTAPAPDWDLRRCVGKAEKREALKQELLECIAPLERGVTATQEDQEVIESVS